MIDSKVTTGTDISFKIGCLPERALAAASSASNGVELAQVLMSGGRSGGEMKNIIWADLPQYVTDGVGIVHVAQGIAARAGHTEYRDALSGDKFSQITTVLSGNSKDQSLHTIIILIPNGGYTWGGTSRPRTTISLRGDAMPLKYCRTACLNI